MKRNFGPLSNPLIVLSVLALVTVGLCNHTMAQGPQMPLPLGVVMDADAKAIAQIADWFPYIQIVLSIGGKPEVFRVRPWGFESSYAFGGMCKNSNDYGIPAQWGIFTQGYTGAGCTGQVFVPFVDHPQGVNEITNTYYSIAGPDSDSGEFKVYQSSQTGFFDATIRSGYQWGKCIEVPDWCEPGSAIARKVSVAVEVSPNPLEGFHGPTTANPERVLTIKGGTRLP